ncbi:MAG: hypothetical protein JWP63_356 [Candidatus Solibacter sp.]|nr:hypothetical protein [Candidatus Solibacter sp.]
MTRNVVRGGATHASTRIRHEGLLPITRPRAARASQERRLHAFRACRLHSGDRCEHRDLQRGERRPVKAASPSPIPIPSSPSIMSRPPPRFPDSKASPCQSPTISSGASRTMSSKPWPLIPAAVFISAAVAVRRLLSRRFPIPISSQSSGRNQRSAAPSATPSAHRGRTP